MKQTNNALKFLLAQYRAIFKQAFTKGLAPALVLTASLAAASAASADAFTADNLAGTDPIEVTSTKTLTGELGASSDSGDVSKDWHAAVTITGGKATSGANAIKVKADAAGDSYALSGSGSLLISGSAADDGLYVGPAAASKDLSVSISSISIAKGTLVLSTKESDKSGAVSVSAREITIGDGQLGDQNSGDAVLSIKGEDKSASVGVSGTNSSKITLKNDGTIKFSGTSGSILGSLTGEGGTIDFTEGSGTIKTFGTNVNANIFVGADKTATITLAGTDDLNTTANENLLQISSGIIDIKQSGATTSGGIINLTKGTLEIQKGVTLGSTAADSVSDKFGSISVAAADTSGASLKIDSNVAKSFLVADNVNLSADTSAEAKKDAAGGIFVSGANSTLELTTADGSELDLYDWAQGGDAKFKIGSGNAAAAGALNISGGATLQGDKLALSQADTTNIDLSGAKLKANELRLGNSALASAETSKIKFSGATVANKLDLQSSGDFVLGTNVDLERDFYVKDASGLNTFDNFGNPIFADGTGLVTGSNLIISGSTTLGVKGGNWDTAGQNLTLSGGTLAVTSTAAKDSKNNGKPAALTIKGGTLAIGTSGDTAAAGTVTITGASGADSVLDLTNANVSFVSGSMTVSGAADANADASALTSSASTAGYGKVFLKGSDLDTYLTTSDKGLLKIGKDGVVVAKDFSNDTYNVTKFTKTDNTSGAVVFSGAGHLVLDGDLNLFDGTAQNQVIQPNETNNKGIDIGDGTIVANNINLINYATKEGTSTIADTMIKAGNLKVSQGFVTNSSTLVIGDSNADKNATLTLDAGVNTAGSLVVGQDSGTINLTGKASASGGALKVNSGIWGNENLNVVVDANAKGLTVGATDPSLLSAAENLSTDDAPVYVAKFTGNNFSGAGAALTVNKQSLASFNTMQLATGSTVTVNGHVVVAGRDIATETPEGGVEDPLKSLATTKGVSLDNATITISGSDAVFEFGANATSGLLTRDEATTPSETVSNLKVTANGIDKATFTFSDYGQLKFNFADGSALSKADVTALTTKFIGTQKGILNLGNADLGIAFDDKAFGGSSGVSFTEYKSFENVLGGKATTDKLANAVIYGITTGQTIMGHVGALEMKDALPSTKITISGPTSLNHANNGYFAYSVNGTTQQVVGLSLADGADLVLKNGGTIGSIQGNGTSTNLAVSAQAGAVTNVQGDVKKINDLTIAGDTKVTGTVDANSIEANSLLDNTGTAGNYVATKELVVGETGKVTTDILSLGSTTAGGYGASYIIGDTSVGDTLKVTNGNLNVVNGGNKVLTTKKLELNSGSTINVGFEPIANGSDNPETVIDESKSYSGALEVADTAILNGGLIAVDPAYGDSTAFVSIAKLSGAATAAAYCAGTLDGNGYVGQNSVLGLGVDNLATLKSKVAQYQKGGSLVDPASDKNALGSILYLGKAITLDSNMGITLTAQSTDDFVKDFNTRKAGGTLSAVSGNAPVLANTLVLGANTAILMDAQALAQADVSLGENTVGAITFAGNKAVADSKGQVIADGGDVIIDGKVRASTYQVFSNADIKYIDGSAYKIVDDSTAANFDKNINVSTTNHFLEGVLDENGQVKLGLGSGAKLVSNNVSTPVYDTLVTYAKGYYGEAATDTTPSNPDNNAGSNGDNQAQANTKAATVIPGVDDSKLLYTYNDKGEKVYNYSNALLENAITVGDGKAVEAAARMVAYGGAAEASFAATSALTDAVAGRLGMGGVETNLNIADNTQGTSLWLAPLYKSHNSSDFGAEGLGSGVDLNLYGLSLGADAAINDNLKVGGALALGSGDVKGKGNGAASLVKNDFSYYGLSAYTNYTMDAFSLVGDLTYTVVDNDITADTSYDKLSSSLDSKSLSLGVTGKYSIILANDIDLAPHAGLRYSHVTFDNYTLKDSSNNEIASFDNKNQDVFSIPVGVTLSKTFASESYIVKPSFDFTVTGNFGDKKAQSNIDWAGVENLSTEVKSTVLDSVTYGATVGVSLQTGNLNVGAGFNYTGSSHADDLGVSANVRYVF